MRSADLFDGGQRTPAGWSVFLMAQILNPGSYLKLRDFPNAHAVTIAWSVTIKRDFVTHAYSSLFTLRVLQVDGQKM